MYVIEGTLGLSVCFILFLSAAIAVALLRMVPMLVDYYPARWKKLDEMGHRQMIFLPSLIGLAYWALYQRLLSVINIALHRWTAPSVDPTINYHLMVGVLASAGFLYINLTAALGEGTGFRVWLKLTGLGILAALAFSQFGGSL